MCIRDRAKQERRRQREANRRADELAKLRNAIEEEFVKKATVQEGIIF